MVLAVAGAIERFLESAKVLGHPVDVRRFPEGTKTAQDAARALAQFEKLKQQSRQDEQAVFANTAR